MIREQHFPSQNITGPSGNACRKRWDQVKQGKGLRDEVAGVEKGVEVDITVAGQVDGEEGVKTIVLKKGGEGEEVVQWKGFVERGWVEVSFAERGGEREM